LRHVAVTGSKLDKSHTKTRKETNSDDKSVAGAQDNSKVFHSGESAGGWHGLAQKEGTLAKALRLKAFTEESH